MYLLICIKLRVNFNSIDMKIHSYASDMQYPPQQRAQVLSEQQRREREVRVKTEKTKRLEASNRRKKEMQELEQNRRQNEKPSDLEQVCFQCVHGCVCRTNTSPLC